MTLPALLENAERTGLCGVKLSDPRGMTVTVACCPTAKQNYDLAAFTLAWLQEMACGEVVEPSVQLVRLGAG